MSANARSAVLALLLSFALLAGFGAPSLADSKDDLERRKNQLNGQIKGAEQSYAHASKELAAAVKKLEASKAKLAAAEAHLGQTRGELATAKAQDAQMQAELETAQAELETAVAKLKAGEESLAEAEAEVAAFTVQSLQEGDPGLRAFGDLLRGESPDKFSERMSLNGSISDAQIATMQRLAASRVMLQLKRDEVKKLRDQVKKAREAAAANLVRMQELEAAAAAQAAEVGDLVAENARDKNEANAIVAAEERKIAALEAERARTEALIADLVRKELENSQGGGGGGAGSGDGGSALSYPVNGRITSPYGMRRHPITGVYKLHDGTDFGASCGTPIKAAAGGTVVSQYYNAGYGNRVILNNGVMRGKSIITTYNHLSRFAVSTGAKVSRGQVIGYVGTTGMSTGCHLHFMVLANGATTNPMGWL